MINGIPSVRSIATKITAIIVLLSLILLLLCSFLIYEQKKVVESFNESTIEAIEEVLTVAVTEYIITGDIASLESSVNSAISSNLIYGIVIEPSGALTKPLSYPSKFPTNGKFIAINLLESENVIAGTYLLYINDSMLDEANHQFTKLLILFVIVAIIVFSAAHSLFRRFLVKPILQVSGAAKAVALGDFNSILTFRSNDEIGDLVNSLNEISVSLKGRDALKEKHLNEIVSAYGESVLDSAKKTKILQSLIDTAAPHLTESLLLLQSLPDKPIQQAMLNKQMLFVLSHFEQAQKYLNDKTSTPIRLEKLTLEEFSKLLNEYVNFFSAHNKFKFEYSLKHASDVNPASLYGLVDQKAIIKLLSLSFEIMNLKISDNSSSRVVIWLIIDRVTDEQIIVDCIARSNHAFITPDNCVEINKFMNGGNSNKISVIEVCSDYIKGNYPALKNLKSILCDIDSTFQATTTGATTEIRISTKIMRTSEFEDITSRICPSPVTGDSINFIYFGSNGLIKNIDASRLRINTFSYSDFSVDSIRAGSYIIIDLLTNRKNGLTILEDVNRFESTTGLELRLAVVVASVGTNFDFLDKLYELNIDFVMYDFVSQENLDKYVGTIGRIEVEIEVAKLFTPF